MDDRENSGLKRVSTLLRCEHGRSDCIVGHVYVDGNGKRVVKWCEGIEPDLVRMIEVPLPQNAQ